MNKGSEFSWITLHKLLEIKTIPLVPTLHRVKGRNADDPITLEQEYIDRLLICPEVKKACTSATSELVEKIHDIIVSTYGRTASSVQLELSATMSACVLSTFVRGYCVWIRKESVAESMGDPIALSCWYEYMDTNKLNTHTIKKSRRFPLTDAIIRTKLIKDAIMPTYHAFPQAAKYIYKSPYSDELEIDEQQIYEKFGIQDAGLRICVTGDTRSDTIPRGVYIAPDVTTLQEILSHTTQRIVNGSAPTVIISPSSYEAMSKSLGSEADIVKTVEKLGSARMAKVNTKLTDGIKRFVEEIKDSIPDIDKAPAKFVLLPPCCTGSTTAALTVDPMTNGLMHACQERIRSSLGGISTDDTGKHKTHAASVMVRLTEALTISSDTLNTLAKALYDLFGLDLPTDVINSLQPATRLKEIIGRAIESSVLENIGTNPTAKSDLVITPENLTEKNSKRRKQIDDDE